MIIRSVKWIVFFSSVLLIYLAVNLSRYTGIYQSHETQLVENCDRVYPLQGAEDFVALPYGGVLISATDRLQADPSFKSGIYWLDAGASEPVYVSAGGAENFYPHGIDLLDLGDRLLLYVVNHDTPVYPDPETQHTIEVFDVVEAGLLTHLQSIDFNGLVFPNDIAVLAEDRFYVSDSWHFLGGIGHIAENYLSLALTEITFYDRGKTSHVAGRLNLANGVALSKDRSVLWVAESRGRRLRKYDVDATTGALTHQESYSVATSPDNITIGRDGILTVAGIPDAIAFEKHAKGDSRAIPSQIFQLDPDTGAQTNLYYDESGLVSGATAGLVHDGRLYIGTAFDDVAISCHIP